MDVSPDTGKVRAFAPGRTELAGNHTDHQGGRVVAAALDCGIEIIARPAAGHVVRIESPGFGTVQVDVRDTGPREAERGRTAALVRGVIGGLLEAGVPVAGFDAHATSNVPAGGGLSSSAAFELALAHAAMLVSQPQDAPSPTAVQLARMAQSAERDWFGKPCGLMDQLSVALGGICAMDFSDGVRYERIGFDFREAGLSLFLIDTGCDHSRYTAEYARVADDMRAVAALCGRETLSQVPEGLFREHLGQARSTLGDRAALRALHYYNEMALVDARIEALRAGDAGAFLEATRRSGASSAQYLQNVTTFDAAEQPAMVALALADRLAGPQGAARIHGGGFGGTVQAFVPERDAEGFAREIEALLGEGTCHLHRIVQEGAHATWMP